MKIWANIKKWGHAFLQPPAALFWPHLREGLADKLAPHESLYGATCTATLLKRYQINAAIIADSGVGLWEKSWRSAGWQGRMISCEAEPAAWRQLFHAAQKDHLGWLVAKRQRLGAKNFAGLLTLSPAAALPSPLSPTAPAPSELLETAIIGDIACDETRLDDVLAEHWPDFTATPYLLACREAQTMPDLLEGAGAYYEHLVGVQMLLPLSCALTSSSPRLSAPFSYWLEYWAKQGYSLMLLIPGYFSRHHARHLEVTALWLRTDWLTQKGL
jgi:hypothetical protein